MAEGWGGFVEAGRPEEPGQARAEDGAREAALRLGSSWAPPAAQGEPRRAVHRGGHQAGAP